MSKRQILSKILIICFIYFTIFILSSCTDNNNFYYKEDKTINIPIVNIKLTQIVDSQNVEKYDKKSLIPSSLSKGIDHNIVMGLQQRLMKLGFMEEDKASTYYGESTESAIKKFERQIGLKEDGICTAKVYDLLMDKDAPTYQIRRGNKGDDIVIIQQRLYELSYLLNENEVNGYFGEKTESAVRALQRNNRIEDNGYIDLKTYNLMYKDDIVGYTINGESQSYIIKLYQDKLKSLGYYYGECSGKYTDEFREAVRTYQEMNTQQADGYIGPSTKFSIDSVYAKPFSLYLGLKNKRIKIIQDRLVLFNYLDPNLSTGYYGEYTAQAVAAFQKLNKLPITGIVDGETVAMIFNDNAVMSKDIIKSPRQFVMKTSEIREKIKSEKNVGNVEDLIKVAMLKLGSKYVWGMKGPKTFDCSGFVYWCLNQVGVQVSYMTTYNWQFTTQFEKVEKFDDLEVGDLILISGHIGIVTENMTVVDASSSNGKVVHRDLDEWWRERFIMGFKIFDNKNNEELDSKNIG